MSTKDLALRVVKDQFGVLAEEVCRFVSNKGHPTFPEIIKNAKEVFFAKVNETKISQCVLSLCLHSILVPVIPSSDIRKIISTRYTFDTKAALYRLRLGSYIQYVKDELGDEAVSIVVELSIRGAGTIDDVIKSIQTNYPDKYTASDLSGAVNQLISRNLIMQKTDIATYARDQNAEFNPDDISRQPPKTRGRGRGRGRGGRGGRGGRATTSLFEGETEWDDSKKTTKRGRSLGDQILEMQQKKLKADELRKSMKETQQTESVVDTERSAMLFALNLEQYTCILRQKIILDYVSTRINPMTANILQAIFNLYGYTRNARTDSATVFTGREIFESVSSTTTWSIFLRYMNVLASDRVKCLTIITPCDSGYDAIGGEYRINYQGVIRLITEDLVANFIDKRYNFICASIFRALLKHKRLDEQQIATMCMLPDKVCRTSIFAISNDRFIRLQEVPRKADHKPETTFYLFTVDMEYCVKTLIDFVYVIMLNLRSRQKVVVMKHASLFEAQRRGNLSEQQKQQMSRMENGLRCMDMSILKLDETLAILRDMYLCCVCFIHCFDMSTNPRDKLQLLDSKTIEKEFSILVDSSLSSVGTAISGLNSEYKHLDELHKMMVLKLKDIHQQICKDGNEWFDKRSDILENLTPFLTNIEELKENSENLVKMLKKIDAYTQTLENRANELC